MRSMNQANTEPGDWPSDLLLMEYLLGSLPEDGRRPVEVWLTERPGNSDRLSEIAEALLVTAEATAHWQGSVGQVHKSPASFRFTSGQLVGVLSLAASLLFAIFSLSGFRGELLAENRIALAWADALPGTDADMPEWIFEPAAIDVVGAVGRVDLLAADLDEADDFNETGVTFGFSSNEPPEWLLAAVLSMGSEEFSAESGEVNQ
jgi:hypothetical protein